MSQFERELRECLSVVLGVSLPVPDYETFLFFKHWLAERNLGLAPIEDVADFDWPGHWLARVRSKEGDHAVVMFGSSSSAFYDPGGALASGGVVVEGWVLARLDERLPNSYGEERRVGEVAAILIAPHAESRLARVERAVAVAGRGLEGDRYYFGRGTFTGPGRGYHVTLVEGEVLDSLDLPWEQARRNIVTRGMALNPLVGHHFRVGAAECVGRRLAEPCSHLASRLHPLVPRETKRWRDLYRSRSAVEREFGRLKHEYGLGPLRVRGLARVQLHADLTVLARLGQALARARSVPLAA